MMIWAIFFVILGICIGSFSNVLIYRLPLNESINFPASHCTNCKSPLKWYHNIPLFSWLFLGGKCAFCKDKISIRYPLIETLGGALMFCAFYYETAGVNFTNLGENLGFLALFRALILGILFIVLLALSAIDFKYTAVPDSLLITSLFLSVFYVYCDQISSWSFVPLRDGAIFAFVFWFLRFVVSKILGREAMGSADIFIAAVMGVILGWKLGAIAVYLSAIFTIPAYIIVRKKDYELPFVPFLALGTLVAYIFRLQILELLTKYYG